MADPLGGAGCGVPAYLVKVSSGGSRCKTERRRLDLMNLLKSMVVLFRLNTI